MLKLFKHMKALDWLIIALNIVLIALQVQLDLKIPDYMSEVTVLVQSAGSQTADILYTGGKMLLCALGSLGLAIVVGFFAAQIAARFSMRLREGVYNQVMSFSDEEMNGFSTASLITRSTNDITQIQMIITMGLQVIIKAPIMAFMAIEKISSKSWEWSLLTAVAIVFIVLVIVFLMVYALPRFKRVQWMTDDLNRITRENLTGLLVVRAYNAESYQEDKFDQANEKLTKTNLQVHMAMSIMNPAMNLSMNGLTLGIYWIGAVLISNVALSSAAAAAERLTIFSNMVVFMSYAMQVVMAFLMLIIIFIMLPRASVSAKRINEVLDTKVRIQDGTRVAGEEGMCGEVEFRNVCFRYPDSAHDVLHNISFCAHRGETVALIGATGCGKSTIINLIPRLYDVSQGEVLVDGVNVKSYTQQALHDKIGFVPQKAFLFSGTVSSNLAYGGEEGQISEQDIRQAVAIAQAKEFVESEECGYDGAVVQGGSNFSGGQKQRLSIARAVAKKPEIYIFDDSFSALDYRTDHALRSALKQETAGVTTILVAQRIGTIRDADRILVIENGEIVGNGKHDELMQSCPIYQEIAYSQLSKEELAI